MILTMHLEYVQQLTVAIDPLKATNDFKVSKSCHAAAH